MFKTFGGLALVGLIVFCIVLAIGEVYHRVAPNPGDMWE